MVMYLAKESHNEISLDVVYIRYGVVYQFSCYVDKYIYIKDNHQCIENEVISYIGAARHRGKERHVILNHFGVTHISCVAGGGTLLEIAI